VMAGFGWYQVRVLEQFYPDMTQANTWLQEHVTSNDCNILVDDAWTLKWALNSTFDTREYCVVDQWTWKHQATTSRDLTGSINAGLYPYIVFEKGGMFSGENTVFNQDVMDAVQGSGRYEEVALFPSYVTWGNAILPDMFHGDLKPNSTVTIEIWKRR